MGKTKKESQSPAARYEEVHQLIESCKDEFLKQKWRDVLAFLRARDEAKNRGEDFPPKPRRGERC